MSRFRILTSAAARIDDIFDYTARTWGEDRAGAYITGLFDHCDAIATRQIPWRAIPPEFDVSGHYSRYRHHLIFFKLFENGDIGIAAILHERMDIAGRLKSEFPDPPT